MSQLFKLEISSEPDLQDPASSIDANFSDTNTNSPSSSCPFPPSSFLLDDAGNAIQQAAKKSAGGKKGAKRSGPLYAKVDWNALNAINTSLGTNVDFHSLANFEGGSLRNGYVPTSSSGVTIDTGVDLNKSVASIKAWGFPKALEDKLTPYAGLKGSAARAKLKQVPLQVTDDEANLITQTVQKQFLQSTKNSWNGAVGKKGTAFQNLTKAQQTVLLSRTYHQGPGMPQTGIAKTFYSNATAGDWAKAEQALRDYGGYKTVTKTVKGKKVQTQVRKLPKWYVNRANGEANLLKAEREAAAKK